MVIDNGDNGYNNGYNGHDGCNIVDNNGYNDG